MALRHFLATSSNVVARTTRAGLRAVRKLSVPAPRAVTVPILYGMLAARELYYFGVRVFVCEPLFKAYCREYGTNFHTGTFLHWVQGRGDIIIGDNVVLDGKLAFGFGARHSQRPVLKIGNYSGINHGTVITVAKAVTIGDHCRIAGDVTIFDSPGHPLDPGRRKAGESSSDEDVKPVTICDNVWIGRGATICPGVTIGEGSVISISSVVMSDVPPNSLVAGNPARKIGSVTKLDAMSAQAAAGGKLEKSK